MKYLLTIPLVLASTTAVAADPSESAVVQVRRNIQFSEDEPVYRDFYISHPEATKLKKDMVVKIVRKLSVREAGAASNVGEVYLPVCLVKILEVFDKLAIAREFQPMDRSESPVLDSPGVMLGDLVDAKEAFMDHRKKVKPQQVLEKTADSGDNSEDE